MPARCQICDNPQRSAIETVLKNNTKSFQKISEQFLVSGSALFRHKKNHMEMGKDVLNASLKVDVTTLEENWLRYEMELNGRLVGQIYLHKDLSLLTTTIKLKERS